MHIGCNPFLAFVNVEKLRTPPKTLEDSMSHPERLLDDQILGFSKSGLERRDVGATNIDQQDHGTEVSTHHNQEQLFFSLQQWKIDPPTTACLFPEHLDRTNQVDPCCKSICRHQWWGP